jgi:RNA polymerase sigma factor (sigma-70 family)
MRYANLSHHPLLSAHDERALAQTIEAGVEAQERIDAQCAEPGDRRLVVDGGRARQRFIESNLRLVFSIVNRMGAPGHVDRADMVQDGMVGLDKAVDRFDWRKGHKFSTYATWWIRNAVQRGLEHTASTVRIPAHRASELRVALATNEGDANQLTDKHRAMLALSSIDSLDRASVDSGSVADTIAAEIGPEREWEISHAREAVGELLSLIDPTTADIIVARYGLDGTEPRTYAEIGAEVGLSSEAARRRLVRALERLRGDAERLVADDDLAPAA